MKFFTLLTMIAFSILPAFIVEDGATAFGLTAEGGVKTSEVEEGSYDASRQPITHMIQTLTDFFKDITRHEKNSVEPIQMIAAK